jgi:hypothetical protein
MNPEIKTKPPGSSSSLAAEVNTNTNKRHLSENSEERKLKRWSLVMEDKGEILISCLPLEPDGWHRNFAKFGVTPDGEIFINPATLSPWAGLCALISGVAIAIEGEDVPILVPLSWAKIDYPQSAEMLKDLEGIIRATVFEIGEGQSHGA